MFNNSEFLYILIWPIVIIGLVVFAIVLLKRHFGKKSNSDSNDYSLSRSPEDSLSQIFLLLGFLFLGVTLLAFNKDFGEPLSWRLILFITSVAGLAGAYYFKAVQVLVFSLIGLVAWWGSQAYFWSSNGKNIGGASIFTGLCLIALLLYVVGHLQEANPKAKRFATVYIVLGLLSVTGVLFFMSTQFGISLISEMTKGTTFWASWQLTTSLFILGFALIGSLFAAAARKLISWVELFAVIVLACLFASIIILPVQSLYVDIGSYFGYGGTLSNTGFVWAIIYNVAIFAELVGMIFLGYYRRESLFINMGAFFLFVLILVKYLDWFFTSLDKSVFFIGAGIIMFLVGWFMEKGRKYMISTIQADLSTVNAPIK